MTLDDHDNESAKQLCVQLLEFGFTPELIARNLALQFPAFGQPAAAVSRPAPQSTNKPQDNSQTVVPTTPKASRKTAKPPNTSRQRTTSDFPSGKKVWIIYNGRVRSATSNGPSGAWTSVTFGEDEGTLCMRPVNIAFEHEIAPSLTPLPQPPAKKARVETMLPDEAVDETKKNDDVRATHATAM